MNVMAGYAGKTVLVTGGLGFLGSNLVHALVASGATVRVLDALLEPYGANRHNLAGIEDSVRLDVADVRDARAVEAAVTGVDVVFHIAAQTSHIDSMTDPFTDLDINCRGTLVLLQAVRKAPCRVVYAGTRGQYGRVVHQPVDERHPLQPTDMYGVHKNTAEQQCFLWGRVHGFPVVSLRLNNTYGPRHQMKHGRYGILNWFIRLAMADLPIPVYEPGTQLRDYNYVDDATTAFLLCGIREEAIGEIFNLGSGQPVCITDLVDAIVAAAEGGTRRMVAWPAERAQIETGDYVADFSHITRTLGWKPTVPLHEGLQRTVAFYREYADQYFGADLPLPPATNHPSQTMETR